VNKPTLDHKTLKARQRREREGHSEGLKLRVHRALSWLDAAEHAGEDWDAKFIFLWIAFNAAYAEVIRGGGRHGEHENLLRFMQRLLELDRGGHLARLVWDEYPKSIRTLIDNPYVFPAFWRWQAGDMTKEGWQTRFADAQRRALKALQRGDTAKVLSITLSRIYTLRNQLLHGGATWQGKVNRAQLRDCARLMGQLVPVIITILMDHPDEKWLPAAYPVVLDGP
jgi:hypothetical protein